jgi:WD40 repeat protein
LRDGSAIVSGWSDECIRFYNSKTGKKINQINNAHSGKVTALTSNKLSKRLYSGGEDGKIKVW